MTRISDYNYNLLKNFYNQIETNYEYRLDYDIKININSKINDYFTGFVFV